jgi:formylglycine-generating enzyme required for sulfatase activity
MNPFISTCLGWLVRASWQTSILTVIVLAVQWVFQKKLGARWRHALWFLVLARLALPCLPTSPISVFNCAPQSLAMLLEPHLEGKPVLEERFRQRDADGGDRDGRAPRDIAHDLSYPRLEKVAATPPPKVMAPQTFPEIAPLASPAVVESSKIQHKPSPVASVPAAKGRWYRKENAPNLCALLWLAGLLFFMGRIIGQNIMFRRRLGTPRALTGPPTLALFGECKTYLGVKARIGLAETNVIKSPAIYGLLRLTILLPEGMAGQFSAGEMRHIFLHELAHVKRRDMSFLWLETACRILHWFNPVLWFGFRRMAADRELACDELVLSHAGERESGPYGQTILKVLELYARPAAAPGLMGILEDRAQMRRRILAIAGFKRPSRMSAPAAVLLLAVALATLTDAQTTNLSIGLAGNQVVLVWPAKATNYVLQSSTNFLPAAWSNVTNAPVILNGKYTITTAISGQEQFYSLGEVATPAGMALIPAGSFTMGDSLDGESDALPTVTVNVSAFYMDTNEVSYSQWQSVYDWATNAGYNFDDPGAGKASNHPVQTVSWYDVVKWSNARSQQAGLTPVYYTNAAMTAVYTSGDVDAVYANWEASGYRLPTEAEWEKAARGGLSGQRFPWGDTISESQANYLGDTKDYSYDLGPNGYNAAFDTGTTPYTSPVGSFAPNGYGLCDMAGNVHEWCWDWYAAPYAGGSDPRGPATSTSDRRVLRGGSWYFNAYVARTALRDGYSPGYVGYGFGFRCVRRPYVSNQVFTSSGMALIPAGAFTMGDTLDEESDAIPTVTVNVSGFYMDTNLISYSQWQPVYNYATNAGYVFDFPGAGKAANEPVYFVDWYDAVRWSNARSQEAGLTPVYYADAGLTQVYKTGDLTPYVNWTASGYRLPTEAEWEKAARGGLSGLRFPWGDTISESQANYYGDTNDYSYDLGPNGYNAAFTNGPQPFTSPVGYFAPNGYGLYDMAGNVIEWCWDWYGTPYAGGSEPRGPASGSGRVIRGGDWDYGVQDPRCAFRDNYRPGFSQNYIGFRCVRGL